MLVEKHVLYTYKWTHVIFIDRVGKSFFILVWRNILSQNKKKKKKKKKKGQKEILIVRAEEK
jgi:hypothetical protein